MTTSPRAAGAIRLLELLPSARPDDVAAILDMVPECDLAPALRAADIRLTEPVTDYVLAHGTSRSLIDSSRSQLDSSDTQEQEPVPVPETVTEARRLWKELTAAPVVQWDRLWPLFNSPGFINPRIPLNLIAAYRRADCPPRFRQEMERRVPQLLGWVRRPTVADYRRALSAFGAESMPKFGLARLRALAQEGLRCGTLDPEALLRERPAAVTVSLALPGVLDSDHNHAPRGMADVRSLMIGLLAEHAGDDEERWAELVGAVDTTAGSLENLLTGQPDACQPPQAADYSAHLVRGRASNILLALAPPHAARYVLATASTELLTTMAGDVPLCPPLVEHLLGAGTPALDHAREVLAANDYTPDSVLMDLLRRMPGDETATIVVLRRYVGDAVRVAAFKTLTPPGRDELTRQSAELDPRSLLDVLRAVGSDGAPWVFATVRDVFPRLQRDQRAAAYAIIADAIGLEAVWALDLQLAGSLERMTPTVRETMATHSAAPLHAAAEAGFWSPDYFEHLLRREDAWHCVLDWTRREDLTREHLDRRLDRWRVVVDLLLDGADIPFEELIVQVAAAS